MQKNLGQLLFSCSLNYSLQYMMRCISVLHLLDYQGDTAYLTLIHHSLLFTKNISLSSVINTPANSGVWQLNTFVCVWCCMHTNRCQHKVQYFFICQRNKQINEEFPDTWWLLCVTTGRWKIFSSESRKSPLPKETWRYLPFLLLLYWKMVLFFVGLFVLYCFSIGRFQLR